jgi:hypothetical protein
MLRSTIVAAAMLIAVPAVADELSADQARGLVIGKMFSYNCFEGTRGSGRVHADGSVVGTVQFRGAGPVRRAFLPAGTLRVKGGAVCASLRGLPIDPCFNLERVDNQTFRGAISGLSFAYCEFIRHNPRVNVAARSRHRGHSKPVSLRPSITTENR